MLVMTIRDVVDADFTGTFPYVYDVQKGEPAIPERRQAPPDIS
ncbi:MAG: hypothetical protein AAFR79_14085 [Pseudomonadota bacterium]